jgi:FKBP-type peptidyl-prolyl cis-trans isomerase FkpA
MKKSIVAVSLVALLMAACSSTKETKSGYKYNVVRAGDGKLPATGQILILNMSFKDSKDSVWSDSRKADFPTMVQKQDTVPQGDVVLEVFQILTKGDSVTFTVSAKDLFEKTFKSPPPAGVDTTGLFTFEIGVTDVISEEDARKLQDEIMAKLGEKEAVKQKEQLAIDTVLIDTYLKEKSIAAQKTSSGLRYIIEKQGQGDNAKSGQTVRVNYSGFLMDGRCFDSSVESVARANNVYNEERAPYEPLELVIDGYPQVMPGWTEALGLMNKGSKMTVYIPSGLAYGPRKRSELITENSVLRFEMELIDIK